MAVVCARGFRELSKRNGGVEDLLPTVHGRTFFLELILMKQGIYSLAIF